jgi:hypothetical protein
MAEIPPGTRVKIHANLSHWNYGEVKGEGTIAGPDSDIKLETVYVGNLGFVGRVNCHFNKLKSGQ